MRKFKNIIFVLFLLIALIYLFITISPKIFKNFYPFGIRTAIVLTGSMEPTLQVDDFVITKRPKEINVNDIISYKDENNKREVLHRVIEINGDEIITQGDANNTQDNPINRSQVTGVYIGKSTVLGKIISFLSKPLGFSMTVTLICIIILIPSKRKEEIKEEIKQN